MENLEKYRKNIYTSLSIMSIPFLIFFFYEIFIILSNDATFVMSLIVLFFLSTTFIGILFVPLIITTVITSFIIFVFNSYKFFSLKKKMVRDNTFDSNFKFKRYLWHKLIFIISFVSLIIFFVSPYLR